MMIQVVKGLLRSSLYTMIALILSKLDRCARQNTRREVRLPMTAGTTIYTWVQGN